MHPWPGNPCYRWGSVLAVIAAATAQAALAEGSVGGHVDVTTDYVFRGLSQTRGKPAIQADLHYQTDAGWFAGAWGSTVDLNRGQGATIEFNGYAGRAWPVSGAWNAKLTAVQYIYPNDTTYLRYDYFELVGALSYDDRLSLSVAWSPNTSRYSSYGKAEDQTTLTYEIVGRWPLRGPLSVTGSVGYYDLSDLFGTGYFYGSAGLNGTFERIRVDLAYFSTGQDASDLFGEEVAGDRWSLTLAWWF